MTLTRIAIAILLTLQFAVYAGSGQALLSVYCWLVTIISGICVFIPTRESARICLIANGSLLIVPAMILIHGLWSDHPEDPADLIMLLRIAASPTIALTGLCTLWYLKAPHNSPQSCQNMPAKHHNA